MYQEVLDIEVGYAPPLRMPGPWQVQQPVFGIVNIARPRHTNDVFTPIYELRRFDGSATNMFSASPVQATDLPLLPDQYNQFDYGFMDFGDNRDVVPM